MVEMVKTERTHDMTKSKQPPAPGGLVGQFFHSFHPATGQLEWQGEIIGRPEPGVYLVELFEWLLGQPSTRHLVKIEDMQSWAFYPDREAMLHSFRYGPARAARTAANSGRRATA